MKKRIVYVSCCLNGYMGLRTILKDDSYEILVVALNPALEVVQTISGFFDFSTLVNSPQIKIHLLDQYSFKDKDVDLVRSFAPDILLVNGWNRLIPSEVFNLAKQGGYGVHAGHPPRGRGRAPIPWTLINGHSDLEVYLFKLTDGADDGEIADLKRVEVGPYDDAAILYDKVALAIAHMYGESLHKLTSGAFKGVKQKEEGSTFLPKRSPEDGLIVWEAVEGVIYNFVRAQSHPYPGAFSWIAGEKAIIWSAVPFDRCLSFGWQRNPGEILEVIPSGAIVQTGGIPLLVTEMEYQGIVIKRDSWMSHDSLVGKVLTAGVS